MPMEADRRLLVKLVPPESALLTHELQIGLDRIAGVVMARWAAVHVQHTAGNPLHLTEKVQEKCSER